MWVRDPVSVSLVTRTRNHVCVCVFYVQGGEDSLTRTGNSRIPKRRHSDFITNCGDGLGVPATPSILYYIHFRRPYVSRPRIICR